MPDAHHKIPVTVIMTVKNEGKNIPHSLPPLLHYFDEVIVVDSHSTDDTAHIAKTMGARVEQFQWNGQYPKKRQWCLDNLKIRHNWIFMIDADEIITDDFYHALRQCDWTADGYFIPSKMVWRGRTLCFGMRNNKLCLFKKSAFHFPIIDDLDMDGMDEIEGHYQPVPLSQGPIIKQITTPIIHYNHKNDWAKRHDGYCKWEVAMNKRNAWPTDPIPWREWAKTNMRTSYMRPILIFAYGYLFKLGFLDGLNGFDYTLSRARYTWRIVRATRQTNAIR